MSRLWFEIGTLLLVRTGDVSTEKILLYRCAKYCVVRYYIPIKSDKISIPFQVGLGPKGV